MWFPTWCLLPPQVSDLKVVVDRKEKLLAPVLKVEKGDKGDRGEAGLRGPSGLDVSANRRLGGWWSRWSRKTWSSLSSLWHTRALEEFREREGPKVIRENGDPQEQPDPLVEQLWNEALRDLRGLLESRENREYQVSLGELANWAKSGDPARR